MAPSTSIDSTACRANNSTGTAASFPPVLPIFAPMASTRSTSPSSRLSKSPKRSISPIAANSSTEETGPFSRRRTSAPRPPTSGPSPTSPTSPAVSRWPSASCSDVIQITENGIYCTSGDFYIDPWGPVDLAVITHAHSDHARPGSKRYVTAQPGRDLLRARLGQDIAIDAIPYGEAVSLNGVHVSLYPAGHVLGSSQV